jgi:ABC-type polysaccharide/polyol phosphate export permease
LQSDFAVGHSKGLSSDTAIASDYTRPTSPWDDLVKGFSWTQLWTFLALRRLRDSYRRTLLGPIWLTIIVAIFVGGFSLIGSLLFQIKLETMLPELAVGYVLWQLLANCIVNGGGILRAYASVRQSRAVPFTAFLLGSVVAEVFKFLHMAVIWPIVAIFFAAFEPNVGMALLTFALFIANCFFMSYILAIVCTRIGDVQYLVNSALQILFFLTPVIWPLERLSARPEVYLYNPLFYLIYPVKASVLGLPVETYQMVGLVGLLALNIVTFAVCMRLFYHRIQFWI